MPIVIVVIVAIIFAIIYWKASLWINIAIFIVNLFIVDSIPVVDELAMVVVIIIKIKKILDLVKQGMSVKKAIDFLSGKK